VRGSSERGQRKKGRRGNETELKKGRGRGEDERGRGVGGDGELGNGKKG
jgi:hypothetical protein